MHKAVPEKKETLNVELDSLFRCLLQHATPAAIAGLFVRRSRTSSATNNAAAGTYGRRHAAVMARTP